MVGGEWCKLEGQPEDACKAPVLEYVIVSHPAGAGMRRGGPLIVL